LNAIPSEQELFYDDTVVSRSNKIVAIGISQKVTITCVYVHVCVTTEF